MQTKYMEKLIQALLKRGFKDTSWNDEDETFTEFTLESPSFRIVISGISLIEISLNRGDFFTVPNCKTIKDLDDLIRLFKN